MTLFHQWLLRRETACARLGVNPTALNTLSRLLLVLRTPTEGMLYSHEYITKLLGFLRDYNLSVDLHGCSRFRFSPFADEVIKSEMPLLQRKLESASSEGRIT